MIARALAGTALMVTALMVTSLGGCIAALPRPLIGPHLKDSTPVVVPYPAPAAKADIILDPPKGKDVVWVDGQWLWRGRAWVWEAGGWHEVRPNEVYMTPRVVRRSDGALVWFEGKFRTESRTK